ncbi:MAG: hypothetical protein K6E56_04670 [Lachnospiraceae bacterium]|nr:hypothetical protein [Lachnospiraceae bacterium]
MPAASIPVIGMYYKDFQVCELHGYVDEMKADNMSESLVPVGEDRKIYIALDYKPEEIESVSYEIRTSEEHRLVAEHVLSELVFSEDGERVEVTMENLLTPGVEYLLTFFVQAEGKTIRYYTKLISNANNHLDDFLAFVTDFHETTFNKRKASRLSTYLEPDASTLNNNLASINIHSSLNQITWADFEPAVVGDPVVTLTELNDVTAKFNVDFSISAVGEKNEIQYYNVREYFRVSYSELGKRCFLHDYDRTVNEIYRLDGECFRDNRILLGMRGTDVDYKYNEAAGVLCFSQTGELFAYNMTEDVLTRVFSFRGHEGLDNRENYDASKIEILRVDEAGNIDFTITGYMNRGIHEGECGVLLYHYDAIRYAIEEMLFIPTDVNATELIERQNSVIYLNKDGVLYCKIKDRLYSVDTNTRQTKIIISGLNDVEDYAFASEYNVLAYKSHSNQNISVLNMESGRTVDIEVGSGEFTEIIGFIENHMIYSVGSFFNARTEDGGRVKNKVVIYDASLNNMIKTYSYDGLYISNAYIEDYAIVIERVKATEEGYEQTIADIVMNHEGEALLKTPVGTIYDDLRQTLVTLNLDRVIDENSVKTATAGELEITEIPVVMLN